LQINIYILKLTTRESTDTFLARQVLISQDSAGAGKDLGENYNDQN
jgi:hypothetical protein